MHLTLTDLQAKHKLSKKVKGIYIYGVQHCMSILYSRAQRQLGNHMHIVVNNYAYFIGCMHILHMFIHSDANIIELSYKMDDEIFSQQAGFNSCIDKP